ncbi:MAG: hypothetical protein INR69_05360 [Mucilaginibacter polytrichastri]|nr:hypothetical protein [Mucilaginibacter polytrichastri]
MKQAPDTAAVFRRLWLKPIIIGVLSLGGLISALVGDGIWDALSWILLGLPVVVMAYFLFFKRMTA